MTKIATSVVICTHNRSRRLLPSCLSVLEDQTGAPQFEVVVVDNGSTDDTPQIIAELGQRFPEQFRAVHEPTLGLSVARNRGIMESRGRIIAFLDDDARAHPGWLAEITRSILDLGADAVGGPIRPWMNEHFPEWFCGSLLSYLTVWDLGDDPLQLTDSELPRGTNMAFEREALLQVGSFSEELGRRGIRLQSCEETEVFLQLQQKNKRILYQPLAIVDHEIPSHRLTYKFLKRRFWAQGHSEAILHWRLGGQSALNSGWASIKNFGRFHDSGHQHWSRQRNNLRRQSMRGYRRAMYTLRLTQMWNRLLPYSGRDHCSPE